MKKRIALSLALLAGLALGATTANAADVKATGQWQIDAVFADKNYFGGAPTNDKTVSIDQRIRTAFQFIANENLKGVLELQYGQEAWGNSGSMLGQNGGGAINGDGNIKMRKAYIDFNWPGTKNRFLVGHQSLSLPAAFGTGSAILDHHMGAAAAIVPITDQITLVGGYTRPYDANSDGTTTATSVHGTSADAVFLYSNMNFTGFNVNPFLAFAYAGANAVNAGTGVTDVDGSGQQGMQVPGMADNEGVRAYWAGTSFAVNVLDPFKIRGDINYGKATFNSATNTDSGRSGWLADIALEYTGLSMMTPEVFFVYSSGEDGTPGKSERMPVLRTQNWTVGTFWMQGGDTINTSYTTPETSLGFWAAGLSLKDIKLIDKLSHTFNAIYFKGTNDKDIIGAANMTARGNYGRVLTDKDSLWEFDLNSKYKIYEELSLGLELGYIFTDFDKDVWAAAGSSDTLDQNAYKAVFMLNYSF